MADSVSLGDHIEGPGNEQAGVSGVASASGVTSARPQATSGYTTEDGPVARERPAPLIPHTSERTDVELSPQVSKSSKSIRLEAPPVVVRPPKVKFDSFGSAALSWFSW